jgi:hypothetical protein
LLSTSPVVLLLFNDTPDHLKNVLFHGVSDVIISFLFSQVMV